MAFFLKIFIILIFDLNLINIYALSANDTSANRRNKMIKKLFRHYLSNNNPFKSPNLRILEDAANNTEKGFEYILNRFANLIRGELGPFINDTNRNQGVSDICREVLYELLIYDINNETNNTISDYHIKKAFDGASKHKNDLNTYYTCMYNNYGTRNNLNKEYFGESSYFIITLDNSNLTSNVNTSDEEYLYSKKNADIDFLFYMRGFCFPQKKIDNQDACSAEDYYNFISNLNADFGNILSLNNKNYTYFNLMKDPYDSSIFFKLLPFLFLIIQGILILLREFIIHLLKICYERKSDNKINLLMNDLGDDESELMKKEEEEEKYEKEDVKTLNTKTEIFPRWVKIYNKCFCLSENFKELFNFSLNSTDINNDSGLSYIRGLKSLSFFFLIFGLTFFTFMNSFSKTYSKFLMNEFLKYFLFPLFFIGLRYSPRIIFSCNGYTLSFKYLSYIQKNHSFLRALKFIVYQIHKYIMLIIFFLFFRYSLSILNDLGKSTTSPIWKYCDINILSKPEGAGFLIPFLDLNIITPSNNKRIDQNLTDYFWLPFNEIFFIIVGIIIISFGYTFRIKIDYIILTLIPVILIGKVIFSYFQYTIEGEAYYATLYYYLFDYGKFMLNPLFNLPYYLIGMFFGLINYSVQKGITSLYKNKENKTLFNLKNILNINKSENSDKDGENEKEENNFQKEEEKLVEKKELREEIKRMPFLKSGVIISEWLRKNSIKILLSIIFILILFLFFSHSIYYFFIITLKYNDYMDTLKNLDNTIDKNLDEIEIEIQKDREYQKMENLLLLSDYITNPFVNFIFRIDIEIMVFLIQTILFLLYFKGKNFINDFFCHVFWSVINKSYYSLILIANPLILYIFYQSETRIILNFFNLLLYSIISGCIVFLFGFASYLFFELPYKRLIHSLCSNYGKDDKEDLDDEDDFGEEKINEIKDINSQKD